MTNDSYKKGHVVMLKARAIRAKITIYKKKVSSWTKIEHYHRKELHQAQADGAKKMLDKYLLLLEKAQKDFKALEFPESNPKPKRNPDPLICDICNIPVVQCKCPYLLA